MLTDSEIVLNAAIWLLAVAALFFGGRAARRRRKNRKVSGRKPGTLD